MPFVSRAGLKLDAAMDAFEMSVAGKVCADFGCNVGGFTDCLLKRGAAKVYALDTGYGTLAWRLRKDERVVVMERTNAMHAEPPEPVVLVVIDVGWTPQRLILPAARRWLGPGGSVVSLLKPHYEASAAAPKRRRRAGKGHVLSIEAARAQCLCTCESLGDIEWAVDAVVPSPLVGAGGNVEFLLRARPIDGASPVANANSDGSPTGC